MLEEIAFRLLRCKADAEDVVHETFVRWMETNQQKISNTKAYLIKSVTNNCFSFLEKNRPAKMTDLPAEGQKGFWKFISETNFSSFDLDQELKGAFDVLHTKLGPLERAVYLLRTAFDVDYEELSELFNQKADYCRQLFSRASRKLEMPGISFKELPAPASLLDSFKSACQSGNTKGLIDHLTSSLPSIQGKKHEK
jgi:RNA polymerase sigma-70 factor (ECF subfamily)